MTATLLRVGRQFSASALLVVSRFGGATIGVVTQILLARTMAPDALGLFFFAMSLAAVLSILATAGYPQASIRFLTRYRAFARGTLYAAFIRLAGRDIVIIAVAVFAILAVTAMRLADRDLALAIALAAAAIPVIALGQLLGAVANTERKFLLASVPELLLRPVGLFVAVAVLVWLGIQPNVPILLLTFLMLCLGVLVIQAIGLRRLNLPVGSHAAIPRRQRKLWRMTAFPLVILSLFTALFADVALLLASPFMPRADLAVFAICLKITFLVGFAVRAVHMTVMPAVAEDLHRGLISNAMARLRETNYLIIGVTLAATILIAAFGDRLLALFDPAFATAHGALTLLMGSQLILALAGPASQILSVLGRQRIVVSACPAALALLCAANAVLIPAYGLKGAAVAILLSIAAWSTSLAYALLRTTGVRSYLDVRAAWRGAAISQRA